MLIVDDSAVARAVIVRGIDTAGDCVVVGAVADADAALGFLRRNLVDGIVLDINMPGIDGLTALPDLLASSGGAKVLIVSSSCGEGAVASVQALALGAADTLVKPAAGDLATRFTDLLTDKLRRLFTAEASAPALPSRVAPGGAPGRFDVVAIGASTGGIHALSALLRELPASFTTPVLITQHLPASFMPYFAAQVALLSGRPCEVAEDRMRLRPGRVTIAPGDAHVQCVSTGDGAAIRLSTKPSASGCLPSVDPMFASVAAVFGAHALGVVLSGMGRDGQIGARAIVAAGGAVVVQDAASSTVWGMPGAVAADGSASAIMEPAAIGKLIASGRRPS